MAIGDSTFSDLGASVSDIFSGFGDLDKAQGDLAEQQAYTEAAGLATQNEKFTEQSTAIKQAQADRALFGSLGETQASVAGAGFASSGSALDILRDSASQGALSRAVLSEQGLITEAGYKEQAQSYTQMAAAAGDAAKAADLGAVGSFVGAGINAVASIATLGLGGGGGLGAGGMGLPAGEATGGLY